MKKVRFVQFIALILLFATACKKKEVLPQFTRGKVTVKVNGELKTFTVANSYLESGVLSFGDDAKTEIIGFTIPAVKEGVYDMSHQEFITAVYSKNEIDYGATNGISGIGQKGSFKLHITKIADNKISGTFEMTVLPNSGTGNEITITEGTFEDVPKL
jgi:hypothetical protein